MAALSDFDRRDAERTARYEIANLIQRYAIRLVDYTKTDIKEAMDEAAQTGAEFDAVAAGRGAAERAFHYYSFGIGAGQPRPAIESSPATEDDGA